jgi:hypothetical protein
MGKCFNRNLPEYKALEKEYGHVLIVDGIIDKFQRSAKNDVIPTVQETKDLIADIDIAYSLKKEQFGNALLANLVREKIIAKKKGAYYIQHSNPITWKHEPAVLRHNINRLQSYIKHNRLSADIVSLRKLQTKPTYRVDLNINVLTKRDLIVNNDKESLTYIDQLVDHLTTVIPGIDIKWLSVKEAEELHDSIGGTVKFNKVNSFYHNGTAVLIKGRVTAETAVEEVLHPFVSALKEGNRTLYNSLMEEGMESFPELIQHIKNKYTDKQGFSKADREMEFVTQALSKHFLHEFKNNPTRGWATKIKEFLQWFRDLIDTYLIKNSGRSLSLNPNKLNKMSLSEVANLLNTSNLSFDITLKETDRIQYSLSSETQKMVDVAKGRGNEVQRMVIDNLFHNIKGFEEETDNLSTSLVILERDSHTYVNLEDGSIYNSTTERIGGKFDDQGKYELNRQLGNDFDHILNSIVEGRSFDSIKDDMNVVDIDQAKSAYEMLEIYTDGLRADGSILLAQVVVSDDVTMTGGTIDLLRIHPNGSLTIIDLKTSRHHFQSDSYKNMPYPVKEGSIWYDASKKAHEQFRLTTKMKHSLQTNSYARMLSNQGFEVNDASQTYHVLVDINKKDGVMTSFKLQGITNHKLSDNVSLVDELISEEVNINNSEDLKEKYNKEHNVVESDDFLTARELHAEDESISIDLYDALFKSLEGFSTSLVAREELLKKAKGYLSHEYTRKEAMREIIDARTILNIALQEGRVSEAYTEFLEHSIKEVEAFKDYAVNPDNHGTREYLNKILNWKKMSNSYSGLIYLDHSKGLSDKQMQLKDELMQLLQSLNGVKNPDGTVREVGVFDIGIEEYIKAIIKETSSRSDLTEETLNELMHKAKDIGVMESKAGDLSTSSDTILAVMDKIFKREKQRMLDEVGYKLNLINASIGKLEKLSPQGKVDYSNMLEYDRDGKFTGNYTKEVGAVYYDKQNEINKKLYDTNGNYITYIEIDNIDDATEEELAFNKEVYKNRQARMEFMRAEERTETGPIDGEYHKFTDEFKAERAKYEVYHKTHTGGYWVRKDGINDREYTSYETKYYTTVSYDKAVRDENGFTGVTTKESGLKVVRKEHTEKRKVARDGTNLVNEKWTKIMKGTSELERAQREFYLLFVDMYENDLLEKLPETLHRIGKAPTIAASISEEMTNKPNIIAHMWAKTMGSMRKLPSATRNVFTRTVKVQRVNVDEYGNVSDNNLPLFFVGNALDEKDLTDLEEALKVNEAKLKAAKSEVIRNKYKKEVGIIKNEIYRIEQRPLKSDVSQDMGESLKMMVGMTENYHVLNELEDTYNAFIEVLEKREYTEEGETLVNRGFNYMAAKTSKGTAWARGKKDSLLGRKGTSVTKSEAETIKRAKKWMAMTFYDNDDTNVGAFKKISKGIIAMSSATYVAFNVFGNLNNYVMGRVNNMIESGGERFVGRNAMLRATGVYNAEVVQGVFHKLADVRSGAVKRNMPNKPLAMIDQFRFMDKKEDMREQGKVDGQEPLWRRAINWGYVLQDAGEFNLQTKIGLGVMMSSKAINSTTGEEISLYDAYKYNKETGVLEVKEGFDKAQIYGKPEVKDLNKDFQYEIRNYIREVNKQIHGNYAYEDRMTIQSHSLGMLAAQFHKWVVPAVKARFRGEYFDENLGWLEGRYVTMVKFISHSARTVRSIEDFMNMGGNYAAFKDAGFEGQFKGKNAMFNIKRTMAELLLVKLTFYLKALLLQMWDDDDDKGVTQKKFENIALYQLDRLYKEQVLFIPLFAESWNQVSEMAKSPIAGTRTLGEWGEAVSLTAWGLWEHPKPWSGSYEDEMAEFKRNKDYFYQRNPHIGRSKIKAQWGRTLPAYYSWKKWESFDKRKNFYIK